eukprot:TRINITY_DN7289_c0_g1_i3.p1 TRINITY_DN7289_c0_g1~~TRINITY_DN7289_c0_g1_i3.p1  ORF type:complete len:705 (+),score=211.03 TRINITY_DN7289_c0_g1_i3:481-2595(+)
MSAAAQDAGFQEFLAAVRPNKGKIWANDDGAMASVTAAGKGRRGAKVRQVEVANRKTGGDGLTHTKTHIEFDDDSSDDEEYQDLPGAGQVDSQSGEAQGEGEGEGGDDVTMGVGDDADEGDTDIAVSGNDGNKDSRKGNTVNGHCKDSEGSRSNGGTDTTHPARIEMLRAKAHELTPAEEIGESGRLFIRNLSYAVTEEDLVALFEKHGDLNDVHVPIDANTKQCKGFAYVTFLLPDKAVEAYQKLDKQIFQGRLLHILPGKPKEHAEIPEDAPESFKAKRALEKKKESMKEKTWNSLYLRSDTVASAMANKMSVKKGDILDVEADSMAVRMALGETHTIADTRAKLEEDGVNLSVLEDPAKRKVRSKTTMMIKNIPYDTSEDELRELFTPFGNLGRVILPITKAFAIIEYLEATEARKAFRSMSYKKFKHVPLYLEWAPQGLFSAAASAVKRRREVVSGVETEQPDAEEQDGLGYSVYVKNLNFSTTDHTLRQVFSKYGNIRAVNIPKKKDSKGKQTSIGYGFVEFTSREAAQAAVAGLEGTIIDDHAISVKFSARRHGQGHADDKAKGGSSSKGGANPPSTKLLVRNLPFEATKKELRDLFSTFAQVKSVRLPRKFNGGHRGFAFVEFLTKQEAKTAFDALKHTHLYGRHLVLEYGAEDDSIDTLREKAVKHLAQARSGGAPVRKKQKTMDDPDKAFDADFR